MKTVKTLWKFSRPHTIIGTVVSIITLFIVICSHNRMQHVPLLSLAIATGIFSNLFIVGINQVADLPIDRINKPYLPIPAGELSLENARIVVWSALFLSLCCSIFISVYFFCIILVSSFIGWAYSMPPFHFKRHHFTAAIAISFVRGFLINVCGFMVFNYLVNGTLQLPFHVMILSIFIIVFSVVIAWFKDLPDMDGDSQYNIKSLALVYSAKTVFLLGNIIVMGMYATIIFLTFHNAQAPTENRWKDHSLFYGNIFLALLFLVNSFSIDLRNSLSLKRFYKRFWLFFFAEYALYFFTYLF